MRLRLSWVVVLLGLSMVTGVRAADDERNLYYLGVGLDQNGEVGNWQQVGVAGGWKGTSAGAIFNGQLYSAESNGCLYVTNLATGTWSQLGKAEFSNTAFLSADKDNLFSIETNGSLFRINPADGRWQRLGKEG